MQVETGHNCGDGATNEAVTPLFQSSVGKKGNIPWAMAALFRDAFDETAEQCLIVRSSKRTLERE
jgi:hypothetical protein